MNHIFSGKEFCRATRGLAVLPFALTSCVTFPDIREPSLELPEAVLRSRAAKLFFLRHSVLCLLSPELRASPACRYDPDSSDPGFGQNTV
jgi:hypothetical protein